MRCAPATYTSAPRGDRLCRLDVWGGEERDREGEEQKERRTEGEKREGEKGRESMRESALSNPTGS